MHNPQSNVVFRGDDGVEIRARLLRLTPHKAVFEVSNPMVGLRVSEALVDFRILAEGHSLYSGRAVLSSLIHAGNMLVCETSLDETVTPNGFQVAGALTPTAWEERFRGFVNVWQKNYRVLPEFKSVVTDMQCFLEDLRIWMFRVELEIHNQPGGDLKARERMVIDALAPRAVAVIDAFIEQFEAIATQLDGELEGIHRTYLRRCLHPLLLTSPFAYRTFTKPLGYAGDYEVVDMMLRPPYEGETLFAKLINYWLVCQAPAEAHRNRVAYLVRKLIEETARVASAGKRAQVFNLGCGPADEVRRFLTDHPISDRVALTLLDFNEETIEQLRAKLEQIKTHHRRSSEFQFVRKSVQQVLKDSARTQKSGTMPAYDFIYCAGLFDYLTDPICKRLMDIFYDMLAPGGLLVATNVSDALNATRPFRYSMEYILDWHLIYRNGNEFRKLAPELAPPEAVKVILDDGPGANVFIEVRKPQHV